MSAQLTSKFTVAVHVLTCIAVFDNSMRVTSDFISESTGVNAVIIRNVLSQLKEAEIVNTRQGSGGAHLAKPLDEITLYDVYKAVQCVNKDGLFHFHENPNAECPVGRNIHKTMDKHLANAQAAMEQYLRSITLKSVVDDTKKLIADE